jgi:hypothetical protein
LIINIFHLPVAIDCKQMFLLRAVTVLLLFDGAPYPKGIHSGARFAGRLAVQGHHQHPWGVAIDNC